MSKYLLAASALAAVGTPALAAADGPYVGIEGGVAIPRSTDLDIILDNTSVTPATSTTYSNGAKVKYKPGWDLDAIAGLKLGLLRLEVEGGYQRAPVKSINPAGAVLTGLGNATGSAVTSSNLGLGSRMSVKYLTANALLDSDFGGGFGGYAGGGVGRAWASFSGDSDSAMALTAIAGLRYALTSNLDAGVKYQYLHTGKLAFNDAFTLNGTNFTTGAKGNYDSHNILASIVYHFNSREAVAEPAAAPAPPPPPAPPPAPATQTCADGSVIMATSTCPAPPAPPPPPPAERGERG